MADEVYTQIENLLGVDYTEIVDIHEPSIIDVSSRSINVVSNDIIVTGEAYSAAKSFIADRYFEGVDLSTKNIAIIYRRSDGIIDMDYASNIEASDEHVKFMWVISAVVGTQLEFCIQFSGKDENGNPYVLKTQSASVRISDRTLNADDIIETSPDQSWVINIQNRLLALESLNVEEVQEVVAAYIKEHIADFAINEEEIGKFVDDYIQANIEELRGAPGSDGVSVTHSWNGTTLTLTSASGTTTTDLKGEKGDPGNDGVDGIDGVDGTDGVSVTHSWNGTTLNVTSASGTSSANLKGEKGDTGAQGLPGTDGKDGEKGADGADGKDGTDGVDGKSAYEIAVAGGYPGTEDEWLLSLKGADGAPGADGKSAYEIAVAEGFQGTEDEWLASLKGADGTGGDNSELIAMVDEIASTVSSQEAKLAARLYENVTYTVLPTESIWSIIQTLPKDLGGHYVTFVLTSGNSDEMYDGFWIDGFYNGGFIFEAADTTTSNTCYFDGDINILGANVRFTCGVFMMVPGQTERNTPVGRSLYIDAGADVRFDDRRIGDGTAASLMVVGSCCVVDNYNIYAEDLAQYSPTVTVAGGSNVWVRSLIVGDYEACNTFYETYGTSTAFPEIGLFVDRGGVLTVETVSIGGANATGIVASNGGVFCTNDTAISAELCAVPYSQKEGGWVRFNGVEPAPVIVQQTTDLTAGESPLEDGKICIVYE